MRRQFFFTCSFLFFSLFYPFPSVSLFFFSFLFPVRFFLPFFLFSRMPESEQAIGVRSCLFPSHDSGARVAAEQEALGTARHQLEVLRAVAAQRLERMSAVAAAERLYG